MIDFILRVLNMKNSVIITILTFQPIFISCSMTDVPRKGGFFWLEEKSIRRQELLRNVLVNEKQNMLQGKSKNIVEQYSHQKQILYSLKREVKKLLLYVDSINLNTISSPDEIIKINRNLNELNYKIVHLEKNYDLPIQERESGISKVNQKLNALSEKIANIDINSENPKFPWPPPKASASAVIPLKFLSMENSKMTKLYEIEKKLRTILNCCGYFEFSYFPVPDGFALVTRLEQINSDGSPKDSSNRWATKIKSRRVFSLKGYLKSLFTANHGYYRVITFIISPHPFAQTSKQLTAAEAENMFAEGTNVLPKTIGMKEYSPEYTCTALIYEFEKCEFCKKPEIIAHSHLTGRIHLEKSKIWALLEKEL